MKKWWKRFGLGLVNETNREIAFQNWFISAHRRDDARVREARSKKEWLQVKCSLYQKIFGIK